MTDAGAGGAKNRDPRVLLDEMLTSIHLIQDYVSDTSYEDFATRPILQDADALRIAIIGEAASHLPEEDRARWASVPWRAITDMRNRLIHGYFALRLDLVWQVVVRDLPALEVQLHAIRDSLT